MHDFEKELQNNFFKNLLGGKVLCIWPKAINLEYQRRMRVKNIGGLSTTWLLGHGKAEGVGRGMCSLPRGARRKCLLAYT